jgi:hypothetical protein
VTPEQAKALREPFPPEQIGKLPKPTSKDNPKGKCSFCGGHHGLPAVHLDYVGHAATTDRLIKVDPAWSWEPMAFGPNGEPLMTNGGMWIWLTVGGVRRPGFGDGANPKEIIGDAIRNAAMRFGVALDLWAKEDISRSGGEPTADEGLAAPTGSVPQAGEDEPASPPVDMSDPGIPFGDAAFPQNQPPAKRYISKDQRTRLFTIAGKCGLEEDDIRAIVREFTGQESTQQIPPGQVYDGIITAIQAKAPARGGDAT